MRVQIDEEEVHVHLALWQKLAGLMRDIRVPRRHVLNARVVEDGVGEAMRAGIKVGLRVPWLYFVARTIRLDEAFIVRRGRPALAFELDGPGPLKRVFVSAPDAQALALRLAGGQARSD